ncbi:hypothetical protein JCM6882_007612 [Rhodosporidiobolus microsporus]
MAPQQSTPLQSFRIHPSIRPTTPIVRPLSILDTACSDFSSFSAAKVYSPPSPGAQDPFRPSLLTTSLAHILSAYPHFAGKLRLARPDDEGRPYQKRFGRVWVEYGKDSDPGVSLLFSERDVALATCLPSRLADGLFDASSLNDAGVYPEAGDVVELRPTPTEAPALAIRATRFSDGGVVLAFKISHTLADASTLNRFVVDWADVHCAFLVSGSTADVPLPSRPFDPEALDAHAADDLDAPSPDPAVKAQYRRIPRTAIDMWAHPERHPVGAVKSSAPDAAIAALDAAAGEERGEPAPWETWDVAAPVSLRAVDLSAEDVQRLWRRAQVSSDEGGEAGASTPVKVTAHDALVGHFWRLSMKARALSPDTLVSLTPAVGVRSRLSPPLPSDFVGSAFTLLRSEALYDALTSSTTGPFIAGSAIRRTINSATPSSLSALLHHTAHVLDPIRVWPYFCGDTHTSMSSWIGAGSYAADFGSGQPILAEGVLPPVDNMLLFEDVPSAEGGGGKWYERGAKVKLALREDVMEKVLADPELRG